MAKNGDDAHARRERDVEQAAVLECFRELGDLKSASAKKLAEWVTARDLSLKNNDDQTRLLACLRGQTAAANTRRKIFHAVIEYLSENIDLINSHYIKLNRKETATYICSIISKYRSGSNQELQQSESTQRELAHGSGPNENEAYVDIIFKNWKTFSHQTIHGRRVINPGVFQSFRRYKPVGLTGGRVADGSFDMNIPGNHPLIIEIFYIDEIESLLITSEYKIYRGTVFINHERILSSLLQRYSKAENGINHRFAMLKLFTKEQSFYSGISMKVGDTSQQPLASECIFLPLSESEHPEIYEAFAQLRRDNQLKMHVEKDSIFADYVSANPPDNRYDPDQPKWKRVVIAKEFPFFTPLMIRRGERPPLFREPSRTLDVNDIINHNLSLSVFRHSTFDRNR